MQISSIIRRAVAGVAAASMLVAVAACGTSKDNKTAGGEGGSGTIEVVASINQWGSVAKDLGGSHVDVTNIMTKTNVEAHDYEPTSQDVAKFGTAKVAVVNGADYDRSVGLLSELLGQARRGRDARLSARSGPCVPGESSGGTGGDTGRPVSRRHDAP